MNLFQCILVPVCVLGAALCLVGVARGHLSRRQGFFWAVLWGAGAGLIALPNSTTAVASLLGIGRGADLVFYLAILAGLWTSVYFYSRYRRLEILLTELARRQALQHPRRGGGPKDGTTREDSIS